MIKVMLVDDHELVRAGIRRILEETTGITVVAEAASGEEALELARQNAPDVVLMDINMPGIGGLEATRKLQQYAPLLKVIALSAYAEEPYPSRMLEAGAWGYLTKMCTVDDMLKAIKMVQAGQRYISADIAQKMALRSAPQGALSPFDALSQRELQVMLMLTQGQRLQSIAEKLCLSSKTISTYRHRLYGKLQVSSDVALVRLAMRYGIIESGTNVK
jgi:two-component system, NarL family, invasion response regulator UvrY